MHSIDQHGERIVHDRDSGTIASIDCYQQSCACVDNAIEIDLDYFINSITIHINGLNRLKSFACDYAVINIINVREARSKQDLLILGIQTAELIIVMSEQRLTMIRDFVFGETRINQQTVIETVRDKLSSPVVKIHILLRECA